MDVSGNVASNGLAEPRSALIFLGTGCSSTVPNAICLVQPTDPPCSVCSQSLSVPPERNPNYRAVRAMNETLKQNRLSREQGDDRSFSYSSKDRNTGPDHQKNVSDFEHHDGDEISGGRSSLYAHPREQMGSQKAISLPSSPHEFSSQTSEIGGSSDYQQSDEAVSTWNKVLELPLFQNKPLLPFQEWNIDYRELTVGTRVGIGFFGEVFRGIWNGTDVAIKVFLEQDLTAENMQDFCNEISILSRLRHPNVILFLGACTKPPHLSMVTEYMEMGSLYYLIHLSGQKKKLSWRRRLKMLRDICRVCPLQVVYSPPRFQHYHENHRTMTPQITELNLSSDKLVLAYILGVQQKHQCGTLYSKICCDRLVVLESLRGLMCIHRMKIVHRDLKSANCLVNKHWTVKICDFGLSRMMTDSPLSDSSSAGTPEWMAPELIRNEPFTEKCDIFSLGVIMWELCTLHRPWEGVPPERVVYSVANEGSRLEIPEGPLGRLIADCWAEPQDRPSCEEILTRLLDCEYSLC